MGCLTFHPASWHQAARDGHVGWSDRARVANLRRVVNNSRFLLLPGVRVPNLASHVDAAQRGSCYAAAGWEMAGHASGAFAGAATGPAVWMRPLASDWRQRLCQCPAGDPHWMTAPAPALAEDAGWQELEFGMLSHPDGRLRQRIRVMAVHWEHRPGEPVAVVFPGRKEQKAACRLLSNPRVTMDDILESHRAATLQRCREETVVLAVQDTTMPDYSPLQESTGGLARLGGGGAGSHGMPTHVTLALATSGRMLGILDINADFRDGVTPGIDRRRQRAGAGSTALAGSSGAAITAPARGSSRSVTGKAISGRCSRPRPETPKRRAFWCAAMPDARARSSSTGSPAISGTISPRSLSRDRARSGSVPAAASGAPAAARRCHRVRPERQRWRSAAPPSPSRHPAAAPERSGSRPSLRPGSASPPTRKQAISWLLLTSEGDADPDDAGTIVDHYAARWAIEEYFKTLRQHTRIEDRRLDAADDLRRCLAFDAIMAWRVFDIQRAARGEPDRAALDFPGEDELTAMDIDMRHQFGFDDARAPPFDDLTIRQAAIDVGKKIRGRKRHIAVDAEGSPIVVHVHPADVQDRDGAPDVIVDLPGRARGLSIQHT